MQNCLCFVCYPHSEMAPIFIGTLRDQNKEQCETRMKRSHIFDSFELCAEVFSLISIKMSQVTDGYNMPPKLLYGRLGL